MLGKVADGLKTILGLSGVAYVAGFIVVNTRLLRLGAGEGDLIDARYVAAGAIFLFVAIPATLFPYLRRLASLNVLRKEIRGDYFSEPFHQLYENNRYLVDRWFGPYVVTIALFVTLLRFYAQGGSQHEIRTFVCVFTFWYVGTVVFSSLAAVLFNFGFYWHAKLLLGQGGFWSSFQKSFVEKFKASYRRSFEATSGTAPTEKQVDEDLSSFVLKGVSSEGFLTSALYKGIALMLVTATTFGAFVYPTLPASIGGGKLQTVVLLLSAEKSAGSSELGLPGKMIQGQRKAGQGGDQAPAFQLLTAPLPLLAKTSEGYFVLVYSTNGTDVVKIPAAIVDGVSYRTNR